MLALAACLIIVGIALVARGVSRLRARRRLFASAYWSGGLGIAAFGLLLLAMSANLYTYHRLTSEVDVATIDVSQLAAGGYQVEIEERGKRPLRFLLNGDEWQLDARFLRWKSWATILGKDPLFRLERISGRYSDIEQERRAQSTVYAINSNPGLDLWRYGRSYARWIPFLDAYYGSSVYVPLAAGARYQVTATNGGLVVRAENAPANKILGEW
jgi:hypothetical protein